MNRFVDQRWLGALVTSLVLTGLLASPAAGQTLTRVRTAMLPIISSLPFFAALEHKFFEQEGLQIENVSMVGGASTMEAMVGGSVDVATIEPVPLFVAWEQGVRFKVFASNNFELSVLDSAEPLGIRASTAVVVSADSSIRTAKDLEGKSVNTLALRGIGTLSIWRWMEKNGADYRKVRWVEMPFPAVPAALETKKIDAAYIAEPFLAVLKERGARVLCYCYADLRPDMSIVHLGATEKWIAAHPDVVRRFVRAHARAVKFLEENPDQKVPLVTKYTRVAPDVARKIAWQQWRVAPDIEGLRLWEELTFHYGLVRNRVPLEAVVHRVSP